MMRDDVHLTSIPDRNDWKRAWPTPNDPWSHRCRPSYFYILYQTQGALACSSVISNGGALPSKIL